MQVYNKPFQVAVALVSKRVLVHNLPYGNEFFLRVHCLANQSHFQMKGCAPGPVLKKR